MGDAALRQRSLLRAAGYSCREWPYRGLSCFQGPFGNRRTAFQGKAGLSENEPTAGAGGLRRLRPQVAAGATPAMTVSCCCRSRQAAQPRCPRSTTQPTTATGSYGMLPDTQPAHLDHVRRAPAAGRTSSRPCAASTWRDRRRPAARTAARRFAPLAAAPARDATCRIPTARGSARRARRPGRRRRG